MKYEYESITNGIFNFTIPGEGRTVQLFQGSRVIVKKKLAGTYLRLLKLVREIPDEEEISNEEKKTDEVTKTTKQKTKVADKITAVTEIEEVEGKTEEVEVKVEDTITEVGEAEKPTPRKRTRRKKTDS